MKSPSAVNAVPFAMVAGMLAFPAGAANVKITPLGSHDGEFCIFDLAMIFEDPDGTRILYDAGVTTRGPNDPRLGKIDAVLLTHVHWDHLGNNHQPEANAGECNKPALSVKATPTFTTVNEVVVKKAKFVVGGEMNAFFTQKVKEAGGEGHADRAVHESRQGAGASAVERQDHGVRWQGQMRGGLLKRTSELAG